MMITISILIILAWGFYFAAMLFDLNEVKKENETIKEELSHLKKFPPIPNHFKNLYYITDDDDLLKFKLTKSQIAIIKRGLKEVQEFNRKSTNGTIAKVYFYYGATY